MKLFNPGTTPVVYDEAGHIVGGGERVTVDALDEHGQRVLDSGYLVEDRKDRDDEGEQAEEEKPARRRPRAKDAERPSGESPESDAD